MPHLYAENIFSSILQSLNLVMFCREKNIDMFYRKKKIIYARRRPFSVEGSAAFRQYMLQSIVEYMAEKGTNWQFDIIELPKLSGIADVDIAATLFTYDMLAKEHEEYWIVISELHKVYSTLHMVRRNELDWSPTICQNHWLIQRKQKKKLRIL
ncbi:hypothetical protein T4A_613 [Trichinella pseudospiralis]|uniref:Uncharacterized protein n=1 Tax=Trichinella pseudospiralis TaxID=6337 RepID=A0A0V1EJY2_TRIPS|nr:hypothetical protein T4A_613 [Trichinella pseudospiralis]